MFGILTYFYYLCSVVKKWSNIMKKHYRINFNVSLF